MNDQSKYIPDLLDHLLDIKPDHPIEGSYNSSYLVNDSDYLLTPNNQTYIGQKHLQESNSQNNLGSEVIQSHDFVQSSTVDLAEECKKRANFDDAPIHKSNF